MICSSRSARARSASSIAFNVPGSSGRVSTFMARLDHGAPCVASVRLNLIHSAAGQLGCAGATVSRVAWTRRQSRPSNNADNCAAVRCMMMSCTFGPRERAILKPFGEQADASAIPEDQLHPIRALGAEHIDGARERIGLHSLANQRRQALGTLAEVYRLCRPPYPHR